MRSCRKWYTGWPEMSLDFLSVVGSSPTDRTTFYKETTMIRGTRVIMGREAKKYTDVIDTLRRLVHR